MTGGQKRPGAASVIYLPNPPAPTDRHALPARPHPVYGTSWRAIDVEPATPQHPTVSGVHMVASVLDILCAQHEPAGRWWFVHHGHRWRVYLEGVPPETAVAALTRTSAPARHAGQSRPVAWTARVGPPEPGRPVVDPASGRREISLTRPARTRRRARSIEDLHVADTRGVLAYVRESSLLAPRYVAGILTAAMCRAAGLQDPQVADLLNRLCPASHDLDDQAQARVQGLTGMLTHHLSTPAGDLLESPDTASWIAELCAAATRLGSAARTATTSAGDRLVPPSLGEDLLHVVSAHWNRLGLTGPEQDVLAVALRNTLRRTKGGQ